jgi:hypothetical protein
VLPLYLASTSTQVDVVVAILVAGVIVGIFGHLAKSTPIIVVGIVMIAAASLYFEFVVAKID